VQRLASANHFPQLELTAHPEWTARNVAEIVRTIDRMLLSSHEGTLHPGDIGSTHTTSEPGRDPQPQELRSYTT
jgi:alkyl hydroperoxide reductase subunit AhpC